MLNLNFKQMKKLVLLLVAFVCVGLTMKAQVNLQQGLVSYYPFSGNANDLSGNNNNGIVNGATLTTDRFGKINSAYSFNGIDNYISASFQSINSIAISFWFKATAQSNDYATFVDCNKQFYSMLLGPAYASTSNSGKVFFRANTNDDIYSDLTHIDDKWYHVYIAYDNNVGQQQMYINSNLVNSNQISSIGYLQRIYIGRQENYYPTSFFKGSIDDIRIYNQVLNKQEIQALYYENGHNLSFSNQSISISKTVEIPINSSELTTNQNVISYQFEFNYDNTKLEYVGNSLVGTLGENGTLKVNPTTGKISIGWARTTKIVGTGAIISSRNDNAYNYKCKV
jgi:hypothetical protein